MIVNPGEESYFVLPILKILTLDLNKIPEEDMVVSKTAWLCKKKRRKKVSHVWNMNFEGIGEAVI